jgi:hypothetical protein
MVGLIIPIVFTFALLVYEAYTAPTMDDQGRIVKEGKKLSDLFKKKK